MDINLLGSWASIIGFGIVIGGYILKLFKAKADFISRQDNNQNKLTEYLSTLVDVSTSVSDRNDLSTFILLWIEKYKRYNYQILYEHIVLTFILPVIIYFIYTGVHSGKEVPQIKHYATIFLFILIICAYLMHLVFLNRVYGYRVKLETNLLAAWEKHISKKYKSKIAAEDTSNHVMPTL